MKAVEFARRLCCARTMRKYVKEAAKRKWRLGQRHPVLDKIIDVLQLALTVVLMPFGALIANTLFKMQGYPFLYRNRKKMYDKYQQYLMVLDAHRDLYGVNPGVDEYVTIDAKGKVEFIEGASLHYELYKEAKRQAEAWYQSYLDQGLAPLGNKESVIREKTKDAMQKEAAKHLMFADADYIKRFHSLAINDILSGCHAFSPNTTRGGEEAAVMITSHPSIPPLSGVKCKYNQRRIAISPELIEKNDETKRVFELLCALPCVDIAYDEREREDDITCDIRWGNRIENTKLVFEHATEQLLIEKMKTEHEHTAFVQMDKGFHMLYLTNEEQKNAWRHHRYLTEHGFQLSAYSLHYESKKYKANTLVEIEDLHGNKDVPEELIIAYERSQWLPCIIEAYADTYCGNDRQKRERLYLMLAKDVEFIHHQLSMDVAIDAYLSGVPLSDIIA